MLRFLAPAIATLSSAFAAPLPARAAEAPVQGRTVVLENRAYRVTVGVEAIRVARTSAPALERKLRPELTLQYSATDPRITKEAGEARAVVTAWQPAVGAKSQSDFWRVGAPIALAASRLGAVDARSVTLEFPAAPAGTLGLVVELAEGTAPPAFSWSLRAVQPGWFSVGFTGLSSRDPAALDFLYQPLVWSWKRFPTAPMLTAEAQATTAAVFVTGEGATEGVAPDVGEIPYRFATLANSRFGLALRDSAGRARPMLFAPLLGGAESRLAAGESRTFKIRYFLQPGDWYAGLTHFYTAVAGYRIERRNAACSLNETFENMVDFALDDAYSGWVEDLKASDYRFDVPGTVKNVAASHVLSIALTTGNAEIYRRRGRPMLEYLLSREKYLYSTDESITLQNPSHFLRGPAVELAELTALHQLTGGRSAVFARELTRLFGQTRQLNLVTQTGGASWPDHLARYRLTHTPADLAAARVGADRLLEEKVHRYPTDFTTTAGLLDRGATFYTDFTPHLFDFVEIFEETGEPRYRDAALLAARQLLLWLRSHPLAPDATIAVNAGGRVPGVFPGRRFKADSYDFKPFDTTTLLPEQRVEAWRTSLVGLPPEAPSTYLHGPIMLAHHAAWLLRLSHLGDDPQLAAAAANGVLGRYANFPGYYFTSLATTVYQQAGYPLHDYYDIKYNAIFYNHVWPHIALLQDYLVSEAYAKSGGRVSFPSAFAPGYAFLTSKVYGHRPGEIFGETGVRLWLPPRAFRTSAVALNHLFGVGPGATYLVLANTSPSAVTADLALDADKLRLDTGVAYKLTFFRPGGAPEAGELRDGQLRVTVASHGLLAVKIHGLDNTAALPALPATVPISPADSPDYFRRKTDGPAGTVTGMVLRFLDRTDAYLYTDITEKQARKVMLRCRRGDAPEETLEDANYPYEFSLPLPGPSTPLRARLLVEATDGTTSELPLPELRAAH
jgi:hypothetical protein